MNMPMYLEYMVSHWEGVRANLIETINKFRDEELDFKPFATAWSVRQIMLHIAHEEYGEFNYGIAQTLHEFPAEYNILDYPKRASIQSLLESVHAQTVEYLNNLDEGDLGRVIATPWSASHRLIEMIGHMIEHEIHHRAELSLILGMLGREGLNA
jgi:uncharacterized damage-inducible protein DinB